MKINSYVVINIITVLVNILNLYAFRYEHGNNEKKSVNKIFVVAMFAMNIILANFIVYIYNGSNIINAKLMILISMMWPIAYIDFKEKRIPNKILIIMLIARAVILIPELALLGNISQTLISMVIATVAVIIACVLCCLIVKGAIGMGDIKLFCVMAIYLGLEGIWSAIFCSLIVSFVIAVFSLATKRVNRKDNIPFAPAILIGTYLSIFLTSLRRRIAN